MNILTLYELGKISPITLDAVISLRRVDELLQKAQDNLRAMLSGKPFDENPIDLRNQARLILMSIQGSCIIRD